MTLELHPEFLKKNGKNEFVVLSYEEFEMIRKALEDVEDLKILREAKAQSQNSPSIPFEQVKKELGL
jgi:PHD/YefM family antitoxin component YafN of YafNO toxin-antitoxin module